MKEIKHYSFALAVLLCFQLFSQSSEAGVSLSCSPGRYTDYTLFANGYYITTMSSSAQCYEVIDLARRNSVSYSRCYCNHEDLICNAQYETTFNSSSACNEVRDALAKVGSK